MRTKEVKNKGHILIVDDEKNILSSLKGILTDEGYCTSLAEDGEEAFDLIESIPPNLVLLDIWIPGMDGLQILKTIKKEKPDIEIIMMSGHGSIDTAVKATKLGAFDFIEKPLSLESIVLTVAMAMEQQKKNRQARRLKIKSGYNKEEKYLKNTKLQNKTSQKHNGKSTEFKINTNVLVESDPKKHLKLHGNTMQRTLNRSVVLCGQGLHSGMKTGLILSPLPLNSGIIFEYISTGEQIPAYVSNVESTLFSTSIKKDHSRVKTIEHIMAVFHMYKINNLLIKIGDEVPIMDGSAKQFCQLIEDGGIKEQEGKAEELIIEKPVSYSNESNGKSISIEPCQTFCVTYLLDYPSPIGKQEYTFKFESEKDFKEKIAPARTFVYLKDYKKLEEMGLASGGKLNNVILLDDEKVINTPLRFPDEFVRHKILDIIGDFYLSGKAIKGKIIANMTGHAENISLLKKMLHID